MAKRVGRPTTYTMELALEICDLIADGTPLVKICEAVGMPDRSTVRKWRIENEQFSTMYAQAREEFADSLVDQILPLADESRLGVKTKNGPNGIEETTGDMVERTRLQLDSRKWLASKILPKKYGEKLDIEHKGEATINFKWGG